MSGRRESSKKLNSDSVCSDSDEDEDDSEELLLDGAHLGGIPRVYEANPEGSLSTR